MKGALSYAGVRRWAQRFRLGRKFIEDDPRPGAPITAASPIKSCAIKKPIDLDPHITIRELSNSVGISMGSVDHILRSQLKLTKVCAKWVPHLLTKAQKETRVRCCRNLLKSYNECDPGRLFVTVTGDETWVQYNTPFSKQANKMWIGKHSDPPMIPRPDFRSSRIMYCIFFDVK
ncbi:Transposase [Oopsacas minuta]|uniref:Transposase n=1 Tax=Oopsacas minuta TaxID=111878 RepID=A0AAV7KMR3_9METZ|nr:Transposase [Oopsacas minuta]